LGRRHRTRENLLRTRWSHHLPAAPSYDRIELLTSLARGRRVIHVGFTDTEACRNLLEPTGLWLHSRLSAVSKELVGIDIASEAVKKARGEGFEAYVADCCDPAAVASLKLAPAELVIAGEIIEHVDSPGALLASLHTLVARTGRMVLTTPNAHSLSNGLLALLRREVINPDHVALYSWYTLQNMLRRHGWRTVDFATYHYPYARTIEGRILFRLQRLATIFSPFVDQGLIAICESTQAGQR
jgi:SAM-dependent methyltransferase